MMMKMRTVAAIIPMLMGLITVMVAMVLTTVVILMMSIFRY